MTLLSEPWYDRVRPQNTNHKLHWYLASSWTCQECNAVFNHKTLGVAVSFRIKRKSFIQL